MRFSRRIKQARLRFQNRRIEGLTPVACLALPAGHFGLGHGGGAHAPDEYYVIESSNPKVQGIDGATRSYVEFLYELGSQS